MTSEGWLRTLAPGTMIYQKSKPDGFWLIYHVEVEEFPGPWRQLHIWCLDPKQCKLVKLNVESSSFRERWSILDVNV